MFSFRSYDFVLLCCSLGLAILFLNGKILPTRATIIQPMRQGTHAKPEGKIDRHLGQRSWLQEDYPSPETDPSICRTALSHQICDPDNVLDASEISAVEKYLQVKKYAENLCILNDEERKYASDTNMETKGEKIEVQMAVALVNKMDLRLFAKSRQVEERAAEVFARYLHDKWGVGVDTQSCGGAGILLFLSTHDRTIYVSRGAALEPYLTDTRLDRIVDSMKPLLRSEKYHEAIIAALDDMIQYIHSGPPSVTERMIPMVIPMSILGVLGLLIYWNAREERKRRQAYARVKSQLNEIDRAHAEALQGRYQATSCPICLEDFEAPTEEGELYKKGSDGQPLKLLRCGHVMDESCWAEWVNSGHGTVTKCPICQQDIGASAQQEQQTTNNEVNGTNVEYRSTAQNADGGDVRDDNEARALRIFRRERNFRLARLGHRYPQFIRPQQIQHWTQSTYDGSLVRDPSFVQSDPAIVRSNNSGGSSGGSRSGGFGGSSSAGGRGGRW